MKILSASQIKEADQYTITHEPVFSIDLMERAAERLKKSVIADFPSADHFFIFCGKGNNGGDGLALARLLYQQGRKVEVFIINHSNRQSDNFKINLEKLSDLGIAVEEIYAPDSLPIIPQQTILIDAILGSGLNSPLNGLALSTVEVLNKLPNPKLSIDIPTGLFADENVGNNLNKVFKPNFTYTFQQPKLSFFHRDTARLVGDCRILDINLHSSFINSVSCSNHFFNQKEATRVFKPREKFTYKSVYGHSFLIAGSRGKIGAALLSGRACLSAGTGLLTMCIPGCGELPVQISLPEAMVTLDTDFDQITGEPEKLTNYTVGIGPGLGTNGVTVKAVKEILEKVVKPMIIDADALNILAANRDYLNKIPNASILTPHIGEFKRLLGEEELGANYLEQLSHFCKKHKVIVILKDAITTVSSEKGELFFVDEGSPALAKAGSGDVLTGIVLALLSNGYRPLEAALLGTYLHGRAGKIAGIKNSMESNLASDTINHLKAVFKEFY